MSIVQWRQIFRTIFKNASDYEFADRIFMTIVGDRANRLITFEDLIICLYDLIQSFRGLPDDSRMVNSTSTTTASFTFSLMKPNEKGHVDEAAFIEYTKCIFELNNPSDSKTNSFGGVWASVREHPEKRVRKTHDYVEQLARKQFMSLDRDKDGLISLADVEFYFENARGGIEALVLQTESDLNAS
uniref:EF-hand domain-containing protein n=1 Tax=Steinernema glaseri TaxID=37863 RepID=A0A1I7YEL0_9BILA